MEGIEDKREHFYPRYELIKPEVLARLAQTMTEGARKYGEGNWERFNEQQVEDIPRHIFVHIVSFMNGDRSEDHLAHIVANCMMYMWHETKRKEGPNL